MDFAQQPVVVEEHFGVPEWLRIGPPSHFRPAICVAAAAMKCSAEVKAFESPPKAEDYEVVEKLMKSMNLSPSCSSPEASSYEGKPKVGFAVYRAITDHLMALKWLCHLIDGGVDVGDFEQKPPEWLGSLALLVQCPAPPLKSPKAYICFSVAMELDIIDQVQRNNLFYGRCFIKGKLCSLVIDSGSTTNIIAESLCRDLNLQLMHHPKPYMLGGICGTGIPVSLQASVPFTVGDYGDTQLLDVAPTPAVDVLFGRPWMSDMKVIYDGYANVYHI